MPLSKISPGIPNASLSALISRHDRLAPKRPRQDGPCIGRALMEFLRAVLCAAFVMPSFAAAAADYPAPKQGDWIAKDFKFHTGATMPELRLHYTTVGEPTGQPVLVRPGLGGGPSPV